MRKLYPAVIAITLALPSVNAEEAGHLFGERIPLQQPRVTEQKPVKKVSTNTHKPQHRKVQQQSSAPQSAEHRQVHAQRTSKDASAKKKAPEPNQPSRHLPQPAKRYVRVQQPVERGIHWKLTNGPLSEALRQKLSETRHHLVWKPGIDYRITVPIDIRASSLPQALDQVSRLYGLPMSVCNGNRTVVVYPAGTPTAYMRCGAAAPVTINDAPEPKRSVTKARSAIREAGDRIWTIEDRGTF